MEISVIIPVYNCEKYLSKCINSILSQTFVDFELILVNNGSIDDSAKICAEFAEQDNRILYVQKENTGSAGEPRNKGIEESHGNYIVFVDADDYLFPNALEILYNQIISMDYDMVIAGYRNFSEENNDDFNTVLENKEYVTEYECRQYFAKTYPNGEAGYLWNKIYKKDIIDHFEVRFPDIKRLEDGVFNVDYFSHVTKIKTISDITYNYKLNDQDGLYKKTPKEYNVLIDDLALQYYKTIEEWGINQEDCEKELVKFALNELEVCFENITENTWNLSNEEQIEYLENLKNNERFKYFYERRKYVKNYVRMILVLFNNSNYKIMKFMIKLKINIKKNFTALYKIIKKMFN